MRKRILAAGVAPAAATLLFAATAQAAPPAGTQTFSCPLSGSNPCSSPLNASVGGTVTQTAGGYQFDAGGTDVPGYVAISNSNTIPMTNFPITVSVQVQSVGVPSSTVGDYDVIRGSKAANWKVEVVARNKRRTAKASCYFKGTSGKGAATGGPDLSTLTAGSWHTITCTDTGSEIDLSVDGTQYVAKAVSTGAIPNSGNALIGAKDTNGGDQFSGWARNMTVTVPS